MTTLEPTASAPRVDALRLASVLYATTLFLSALLLFLVQPMFTKMVLPRLGGSPAVWSVAVLGSVSLGAGLAWPGYRLWRPITASAWIPSSVVCATCSMYGKSSPRLPMPAVRPK